MAQLPPKIPHQNWPPAFPPHQRMPPLTTTINTNTNSSNNNNSPSSQPSAPASWVDEFLDFTSTRRVTHRRSISDSVAYLETHHNSTSTAAGGFDRLDDEQLMSMFNNDDYLSVGMKATPFKKGLPSSSRDQNSNNDDITTIQKKSNSNEKVNGMECFPKSEPSEVESGCDNENNVDGNTISTNFSSDNANNSDGDPHNLDPKRIKRILANRQSAQRSRVRKLQYMSELERSVTTLQTEVSTLSPRVAYLDHQRLILNVDNSALKQRMAALAQDKIFKDAHQEALKKEIDRLRQIYHQQQQQNLKMSNGTNCSNTSTVTTTTQPPSSDHNMGCTEKEQLMT